MNDVTVVTSVTYPSPESLALVADVQYHEPYLSAALNRKFRGIVDPGFYAGFLPKPGGGMNLLITSVDGDKTAGAASVDIGEFYQVTIQHRKDISLALNAGKKYAIVLKGRYLLGEDTYQVNTASHIHAAEFVARTYTDSYQLGDGELLVCTVNIPAGVSTITQEMIDTSERINRTIGIDISDSVTSTRSDVAASSLAVKKAYDLAKSKYTAQDASTTQKGLVQLSSATNSTSEVLAATPKAVKAAYDLANGKYTAQDATTAQKGIVQLSSDTNSTSETLAATPKAVKAAYDLAAGKAPSSHTHPWNQITGVPTASLTAKGITQLSSATDSTSEVLAATPKAVKAAYDLANGKYTAQDATTAQKGIVQLSSDTNSTSETLAATPKAVKAAYDLAAGKAPSSHTHPWNQITGVPTASLTAKGITQLSSATDSTSEVLAATPKAVKAAYDLADGKYTAQDATTTQKGIVQLSSDTDSESETEAATPKAVKAIKTDLDKKQPLNDMLTALSKLMPAGNAFPYFDADKKINLASISEIARQFISLGTLYSMQEFLVTPDLIARRIRSDSATFEPDVGNVFLAAYMRPAEGVAMTARGRLVDSRYLRDINIELNPDRKTLIFNVDDMGTSSFPGSYAALYGYIGAITGYEIGLFIRVK
ncbi:tail fiber protein [Escherichia coli]|uniref:tail fiber protein n=1 Tax=Escherichia coli TaxID=562 RepID=UPI001F494BAC|nr:tail fiber protein [Escherichia coli]